MAQFRLIPGTDISVNFDKSQYEVGENVNMTISFSVEGKELVIGGFWTAYADVYIGGQKFITNGDQNFNAWGTADSFNAVVSLSFVANTPGTITGYVVSKAKAGV